MAQPSVSSLAERASLSDTSLLLRVIQGFREPIIGYGELNGTMEGVLRQILLGDDLLPLPKVVNRSCAGCGGRVKGMSCIVFVVPVEFMTAG